MAIGRAILVTGGTGFIGSALARELLKQGFCVRLMGRDFSRSGDLAQKGADFVAADLRDAPSVIAACADVEAVFHVGALSAPWGRREDFWATNVGGTEAVIAGCQKFGVKRLIYVSSPSVVFNGQDQVDLRDDTPYPRRFASVYSETKKVGEDRVNAASRSGLACITLRPKAVYGPGDTALLPRLIAAARAGRLPQIGDGRNRVELTYVDDVVQSLLAALEASANALGCTYTITGGEPVLLWDVIREVLRRSGVSDRLRRVSVGVALAAAALMEAKATLTGREPLLTRYTALILARTQTYDTTPARRDLEYIPRISLDEGITRTLEATHVHA